MKRRPKPAELLVLEEFLPYRLSILSNRVSRAIAARYAKAFNLSIPEWRVIAVLARRTLNSPHFDGGRGANFKSKAAPGNLESKASLDLKCDKEADPDRGSHLRSDALARQPGLTAKQVAEATEMDKVAVSRAVARLVAARRIVARTDDADARRQRLWLSPQGEHLHARIAPIALAAEQRLLAAFTAREREQLGGLLDRLIEAARGL